MHKWRLVTVAIEMVFIVAIFMWTFVLATNNALQIEGIIKEFCGDDVRYRVNGLTGEFAIQSIPMNITAVRIP